MYSYRIIIILRQPTPFFCKSLKAEKSSGASEGTDVTTPVPTIRIRDSMVDPGLDEGCSKEKMHAKYMQPYPLYHTA